MQSFYLKFANRELFLKVENEHEEKQLDALCGEVSAYINDLVRQIANLRADNGQLRAILAERMAQEEPEKALADKIIQLVRAHA